MHGFFMTKDCDMTDFWMNDFSLLVTNSRCPLLSFGLCFYALHLGVSGLLPLHVSTHVHGLVFTAFGLFLATLVFSDLYPKLSCFLVFLAFVFMIYGECVYGCLHAVDFLFFLCLPTDLYIHEGSFCFHCIWLAKMPAQKIYSRAHARFLLRLFSLFVFFAFLSYPFASF